MAISKLDLVVLAAVGGGMLWIEHGHRINIAPPTAAEVADPAAAVCPDSDSVPFSADCIALIGGGRDIGVRSSENAAASTPAAPVGLTAPACPSNNENRPYSAQCLRYLSGWFWQADPTKAAP